MTIVTSLRIAPKEPRVIEEPPPGYPEISASQIGQLPQRTRTSAPTQRTITTAAPSQPAPGATQGSAIRPGTTAETGTKITIPISQADLDRIARAKAAGQCVGTMKTYFTVKTYKVSVLRGDPIYVQALSDKEAKQKAKVAGYSVASVRQLMSWEKPSTTTPAAQPSQTTELTKDQKWLRDQLTKKGQWKADYIAGDGFDLVRMLEDIKPAALREIFGNEAVHRAQNQIRLYESLDSHKDAAGNYDLIGIAQDRNISRDTVREIFGEDTYKWVSTVTVALDSLKPYQTDEGYSLSAALADGALTKDQALSLFDQATVNDAIAHKPTPAAPKGTSTARTAGLIAGDVLVPFFYVSRNWDNLSVGERVGWIAADLVFFIAPMAAAGVRGARGAVVAGRAARVAGAARGVGKELVAFIRGPVETVMHPIATTKQGTKDLRSLITNIAHPKKIPEAVITTTEGTLRLKLTNATSLDEFMTARDKLMKLAARGEKPLVQLKDKAGKVIAEIQLSKAPLMREAKGMVHTTPWGGYFKEPLKVEAKAGLGLTEQGLFVTHEPLPRFARQSAFNLPIEIKPTAASKQVVVSKFGYNQVVHVNLESKLPASVMDDLAKAKLIETAGEEINPLSGRKIKKLIAALRKNGNIKAADALQQTVEAYKPIFRIMSPDKAKEIVGTGKVYRGTVEMEAKFPVGAKIQPPKQVLFTHIGPEGTRVEIWLDKPLTAKQILKLKAEGLAEVFRQPFRAPLKVKTVKGGLTKQQVKQLAEIIEAAGNPQMARSLERAYELARSRQRLAAVMGRVGIRAATAARAPTRATRAAAARAAGAEIRYLAEAERVRARERPELSRARARIERAAEPTRAERLPRTERRERIERIGRRERLGRPERIARVTRPERIERPERVERIERPVRITRAFRPTRPTKPQVSFKPVKLGREKLPHEGPALAVWKQGMYYVSVYPPFRTMGNKPDVVYSRHRPQMGVTGRGRRSPMRTLRTKGRLPQSIQVPMGVVTARVRHGRRLTFARRRRR